MSTPAPSEPSVATPLISTLVVLASPGLAPPALTLTSDNGAPPAAGDHSARIAALQQQMLSSAGRGPQDWNPIARDWFDSPAASVLGEQLSGLLGPTPPGSSQVFQQPHITALLPLWQRQLQQHGHRCAWLLLLCSPQAINHQQLQPMPAWQAQLLWLRHALDAEAGTRGQQRYLLNLADPAPDWATLLAPAGSALGLRGQLTLAASSAQPPPARPPQADARDSLVMPATTVIDDWSQHCWQALQMLGKDPRDATAQQQLDTVRAAFDAACSLLGGLLQQHHQQAGTLSRRCQRQQAELDRLATELSRAEADNDQLRATGQQQRQRLDTALLHLSTLQTSAAWYGARPLHWLEQRQPGLARRVVRLSRLGVAALRGRLSTERQLQTRATTLLRSGLFDPDYYIKSNPELILAGHDPLRHWLVSGWREQRQPHPLFDTGRYLQQHPELNDGELDPLSHYLASDQTGDQASGSSPCTLFDPRWYLQQSPEAAASGLPALLHYLRHGAAQGLSPSPLFDHNWYLQQSPDVAASGINPLIHYLDFGAAAGRDPCPLFSSSWYLQRYPDVAAADANPLRHFIEHGADQDRDPGPQFDTGWYRRQHPEINASGINPLAHYLDTGVRQQWPPAPGAALPVVARRDDASAILDHSYPLSRLLPVWDGRWQSLPMPPGQPDQTGQPGQRILIIDQKHPTPDQDSGSFRMRKIIDCLLALGLEVVFVGDQAPIEPRYIDQLEALGVRCLSGRKAALRELLSRGMSFATVLLSRPAVCERYLPLVRAYAVDARVLYDTVDLHWLRLERGAQVADDPEPLRQAADHYRRLELANARAADITIAITDDERELLLQRDAGLQVSVIPNIHDIATDIPPFEQRSGLLFIGSFAHSPNVEAAHYLVNTILPLVSARIPDIRLRLVGSHMPDEIAALASAQVDASGYVEDLGDCFRQSRLFVAPLLHGAGMKGKVGQALSQGLPVATTSIGAEGIGLRDRHSALISDQPQELADSIIACYQDPALWQTLSDNGRQRIAGQFSPAAVAPRIAALMQRDQPQRQTP